ncbi:hypothetical protein EON67_01865 [archaeon]|nr:MAG: hypothetical protein EON67_01865 [archaeon]
MLFTKRQHIPVPPPSLLHPPAVTRGTACTAHTLPCAWLQACAMSDSEVADELAALESIYGNAIAVNTLHVAGGGDLPRSAGAAAPPAAQRTCVSVMVACEQGIGEACVSFVLEPDYPASLPTISLEGFPRGVAASLRAQVQDLLAAHAGAPMLFTAVEYVRDKFGVSQDAPAGVALELAPAEPDKPHAAHAPPSSAPPPSAPRPAPSVPVPAIYSSEPLVVSKSTFIAHVAHVTSMAQVEAVMAELLSEPRIARATHNIRAYRFVDAGTHARHADNDDDGEDAAGGRLAHLLELMKADNVLVVVSRWFGGVLLGPSRFKYINDVARTAIEAQPWYAGRAGAPPAASGSKR